MASFKLLSCASLTAALAGASVLNQQQQLPLQLELSASSSSVEASKKPIVDSEELQASIKSKNLYKRAERLYEIAKLGQDEFNHPTRVIGSDGMYAMKRAILTRDISY